MKKSIICLIGRTVLVMVFSLYSLILFSQERNLKSEILVFFMPDSLELPAQAKSRMTLTNATIKSKQLSDALQKTKPIGIEKAFPDWQNGQKANEENKEIELPPFDRIFILTFNTEAEADVAINILSKTNGVVFAEKHSQPTMDNDEHYINGDQWYLNNNGANGGIVGADINAEEAWSIYTGNTNNIIAIIDNGVEINHEDLSGKVSGDAHVGYSHGTSVAGVAAARANNTHGIRGVDWNAQILSKRVRDSNDNWLGDNVAAQKIVDAVNEGADVLNCSWSTTINSSTLAVAFAYVFRANRITVATMGNTGTQETRYPGAFPNVMAIGATQNNDIHAPYSTTGTHIDVVAPGGIHPEGLTNEQDIITITTNNNYTYTSGTSFAAPQVAGLASLLEGYNSNLDNDDIRQIIRLSADDNIVPEHDNQYGFGRINAGHALEFLQAPYALRQWTASSGNVQNIVGLYTMQFLGAPGIASANYFVKRYEVRKTVTFPEDFIDIIGVWGRGVTTNGLSMANPNFGEGFCEVVPGTLTTTGVTLRTYVYKVYTTSLQYVGYYPTTPANATFAYSVLGIPAPPPPALSAPDLICYSGSTVSVQNVPSGATITWGGTNVSYPNGSTGTSVTVRAISSTNSYNGTITATVSVGGTSSTLSKAVWVGPPKVTGISGNMSVPTFQNTSYYPIYEGVKSSPTDYLWYVNPSNGVSYNNYGLSTLVNFSYPGNYQIICSALNTCGWGNYYFSDYINVYGSYSLMITPNPSSGETTISIETGESEKISAMGTAETAFDETAEWELEVFDNVQSLKEKKIKLKGKNASINTQNWKEGVYLVRARYKDEILTGKLVVGK